MFQYLNGLPRVSSISTGGDEIEFEMEDVLPDLSRNDTIILVADYAGQIVVAVGRLLEFQNIGGPEVWTRLKIKGVHVTFSIPTEE